VLAQGQGGLLDVALSPDFATDRLVYWSYAEPRAGGSGTAVARGRLSTDETRLEAVQVIFQAQPTISGTGHYGSRLVFDRAGRLYVSLGDRQDDPNNGRVQALTTHFGKVVRINADGSTPADNPFVSQAGALGGLFSRGHRNVQGATLHPDTGDLWTVEHGPAGGDEVNVVRAGRNYGWPDVSYGENYDGTPVGGGATSGAGIEQPVYFWDPVIAPSGMTFYAGAMFPEWRGHLFVASLAQQHLVRLEIANERVVGEERLLVGLGARIRDVAVAADGAIWVVTDETNGRLVRLGAV
jgi:glucose/arabinose dehydrogenase